MSSDRADDRLHRLLGGRDTVWLLTRVRRRMEFGQPLSGTITLSDASAAQRRAVELLLGRSPSGGTSLSVSLDELDRTLRTSGAAPGGLAAAAEVLGGPVQIRNTEAQARAAAWREAYSELDVVLTERPELAGWRAWLDSTGVVRRLAPDAQDARPILDALARVVLRLPSAAIPLGRLAAEACGDAHALDEGRPVGTLALSAARAITGSPHGEQLIRRDVWASVGVHLDDLSSTVLCLGLPGDAHTPLGRILAVARDAGEPCVLTLRQLSRHEGAVAADLQVRLCENPVVVAAAAETLGRACPPLVCVNGHPSAAVWRLLALLSAAGARFAYHGDFDWGGMAIATSLYEGVGWTPWRFDAAAYEAAPGTAPLSGTPIATPWDPQLAPAMTRRRVRVEEELVLDDLLSDLVLDRQAPR